MKVALKLAAAVLLEIVVLLAIDGLLAVHRETQMFQADMQRDALQIAHILKDAVIDESQSGGMNSIRRLLGAANREQHALRIRWVSRDPSAERLDRPMAPLKALEPLGNGKEVTIPSVDAEGRRFLCTYVPVDLPSQPPGAIELAEPLSQLDRFVHAVVLRNIVLGTVLVALGGVTVVGLGVYLIGRPLNQLVEKARQIGEGDLTPSLDPRGNDEMAVLAQTMNTMCRQLADSREQTYLEQERRIAAMEQLRHADRLRTVGQLAAGIAHELGTPLNTISIRSGMIADGELAPGETIENAQIIKSQSGRMTEIIRELLDFARPRAAKRSLTDVRTIARTTVKLLVPLAAERNVTIGFQESEPPCAALVDADQIQQVLTNLLVNAIQASPVGGRVDVDVSREDVSRDGEQGNGRANRGFVCVSVRDNGEGISRGNLPSIFDPFFTTKDVREGTGLGLSVAYGIVQEQGGRIDVSSQPGQTCFAVYLPAQQ